MKRWLQTALVLFSIILVAAGLTGCRAEGGEIREGNKEEIFTKTIHDFGELRVENLDEQEDTNFIVYAEDVREIAMTDQVNILTEADEEERIYTFSCPDEELLSMEEGDVFYGVSERYEAVCVKVESMEETDGQVTIHGGELVLSDLFAYVDIDMEIDYTQLYFDADDVPEDCTVEYENPSAAGGLSAGTALLSAVPGEGEAQAARMAMAAAGGAGTAGGLRIGASLNMSRDAVTVQGAFSLCIQSVQVEFRYTEGVLFSSFVVNSTVENDASVTLKGDVIEIEKPLFGITVPVGGPILGMLYPSFLLEASGEIQIGLNSSQSYQEGYSVSAGADTGFQWDMVSDWGQPTVTPRFEDISGNVKAGVQFTASLSCMRVADIHAAFFGGMEIKGSYDPFAVSVEEQQMDSVHDCRVCIDGDANLLGEISVGAGIGFLPGQRLYQSEMTLVHLDSKFCDFYLSFGDGGGRDAEFGWNAVCPHRRYRTLVTVLDEAGENADGAQVTATYPDGRTETVAADGTGMAEFFLPEGENSVTAVKAGERASISLAVTDQPPITALMRLQDQRQIFVGYRFYKDSGQQSLDSYPELTSLIQSQYPDAVWINEDEWMGHSGGNNNTTYGNYTLQGMQEAYGLSAGDIIIYVAAGNASTDGYSSISIRVGMALLPEETEDPDGSTEREDAGAGQDTPLVGWFYHIDVQTLLYTGGHIENSSPTDYYADRVYYLIWESIYHGLEYDEEYRITNIGTGWTQTEREEEAPNPGTTSRFYASSMYQPLVAQYAAESFPYVELLLADEWLIDIE